MLPQRRAPLETDFDAAAEVAWHNDEANGPADWSGATDFASLREALDAIVNGTPHTGHPWVRSAGRIYAPHEVEDLWRKDRML